MKRLLTIGALGLMAAFLAVGCARDHLSKYYGVPYEMNFDKQVINPQAPTDDELNEEVNGPVAEIVYGRYTDSFKYSVPKSLTKDRLINKY